MYQALYRKWRPRFFDDVVGQEHITRTLKKQVMTNRLSHAYLFTGTRGTGKTTCAKIMARAVNCEHSVEGNPCGKCPACLGIESGAILDVVELDAASNNGVDQVRALRDEAVYAPAAVKKRVYIVDEVHMLSVAAFNALLKILEEPPEHLMFILATTELHKVPATILSRCQRFSFKRIQPADIQNRLLYIAQNESIDLTAEGAAMLARLADGALRDALSLLDQCAISGRKVDRDAVLDTLGLAGNLRTAHLMDHIRRGKTAEALKELNDLYASGKDVSAVLDELSGLTRDLLLRQTTGSAAIELMAGGYDEATLKALSKGLSPQRLLHMLTLLQKALADLKASVNRKTDAELCLIRLCDQRLDGSVLALSERLSKIEAAIASGTPVPVAAVSTVQEASPPPFEESGAAEELPPAPLEEIKTAAPPDEAVSVPESEALPWDDAPVVSVQETSPAPASPPQEDRPARQASPPIPQSQQTPGVSSGGDPNFWNALAPELKSVVGPAVFGFIRQRMITGSYENGVLTLYTANEFIQKRILMPRVRKPLEETASARAGRPVRVLAQVGTPAVPPIQQVAPAQPVPVQSAPVEETPREPSPSTQTVEVAEEAPPVSEEVQTLPPEPPSGPDPLDELLAFAAGPGKGIITVE